MFFNLFGRKSRSVSEMTDKEVFEIIKPVIIEVLGVCDDDVTLDAHFMNDLGADELDCKELQMLLGERCNIVISESDSSEMMRIVRTVQDLVDFIKGEKGKIHQRKHSYFSREVRLMLSEVLGVSRLEITSSSHLVNDLAVDALYFADIVVALAEKPEFGVPATVLYMPNEEAENERGVFCITDQSEAFLIATVGDLVQFVERFN